MCVCVCVCVCVRERERERERVSVCNFCLCINFAGTLVLSASQTEEKDTLWMVDSDLFPFQTSCMESHVSLVYQEIECSIGDYIYARSGGSFVTVWTLL